MGLKPGYKQTEVGEIPEEWEVKPLGEVVDFLDGRRRPVKDSDRAKMRGDIPYYGASGIVDYVNNFLFDEELILLGEDGENILSRNCRLAFKISGKTWVNNHAHVLRPKAGVVLDYLVEFLESRDYAQYNTGTAQPKLNKVVCSRIPVLRPPLPEQHAIAEVLTDVDALLGGLDRLIVKKRDLKQATMQQLLTGQTRLPGFHGDWETKELGKLGKISGAGVDKKIRLGELPVRLVNYMDVYCRNFIYSKDLDHFVSASVEQAARCAVRKGDVFFTPSSEMPFDIAVSAVAMEDIPDACYSYHVVRLRLDEDWDLNFRAYAFKTQSFLDQAARTCEGSGVRYVITQGKFRQLTVRYPTDKAEQTAIAEVFREMDAELTALEYRREKTRAVKQGMMQELLTGKTRLILAKEAHA
jgi:type I restriction enzyme S subunit